MTETGPIELTGTGYFDWSPPDSPVSIHMHLDAVDGIAHDVAEGLEPLPRRGVEAGGLLLGRVEAGDKPSVWVDRYQRIPCEHRFGPQFLLDDADQAGLERAAARILEGGEMAVVGLYRSHMRDGFQPELADFELIHRYFSDPSDLLLLIKPESTGEISARFYAHDSGGGLRGAGDAFPFRGRVLTSGKEQTTKRQAEEAESKPEALERPRRLVPDFVPSPVEPARPAESFLFPPPGRVPREEEEDQPSLGVRLGMPVRWLPFIALFLAAGGALWWFSRPLTRESPAPASVVSNEASNEPARPLGLAVEPMGQALHISWNSNATALHDSRSVQLFVRDGDDQNRIDLSPRDLAAGNYEYPHAGNDVTFRLEVVDRAGSVSAESFRLQRGLPTAKAPIPAPAPAQPAHIVQRTEPKAIHRAPPIVAAGVRPRITGMIPIDVRVHIDERGRVASAAPVAKPHPGLESYLAASAVEAARLWRFEPAREDGKAVPGTQTIHFVFRK